MSDDNSESPERLWFPARLRELRLAAGKKQKDVAAAIGMLERSYANVESSNFKRMRLSLVHRVAKLYGLGETETLELVNGWEALPQSPYNQRMAKPWSERNERRGKLKNFDKLKLTLLEVTMLWISGTEPGCACPEAPAGDMFAEPDTSSGQSCELCSALKLLGLTGWTNLEDVTTKLAAVTEAMTG